jgi:hypothetical protein
MSCAIRRCPNQALHNVCEEHEGLSSPCIGCQKWFTDICLSKHRGFCLRCFDKEMSRRKVDQYDPEKKAQEIAEQFHFFARARPLKRTREEICEEISSSEVSKASEESSASGEEISSSEEESKVSEESSSSEEESKEESKASEEESKASDNSEIEDEKKIVEKITKWTSKFARRVSLGLIEIGRVEDPAPIRELAKEDLDFFEIPSSQWRSKKPRLRETIFLE